MADKTHIEWSDATWNPLVGCTKVSPGCDNCYAETLVNRFAGHNVGFPNRFDVVTIRGEKMLTQPLRWKRPRRIFVNSLSDLFHADVPELFIAQVFAVMALAPRHTFQLLTKRHGRMRGLLSDGAFVLDVLNARSLLGLRYGLSSMEPLPWPLPNVWLGVSTEDQHWADIRIPALLGTPAAVRWISAEPLLGPISLDPWHNPGEAPNATAPADARLDWVVVGGESGRGARPMHPDWARALRDQCALADVPFLFKQWGEWAPDLSGTHRVRYDGAFYDNPPTCVMSNEALIRRVGKKAAGRQLDGRTYDGYPA